MEILQGKVAIVTGGGSGIGAACSRRLGRAGAAVVVADIDDRNANTVAEEIVSQGGTALGARVDIGDEGEMRALMALAEETFGGIDILHNNAADTRLSSTRDSAIEDMDLEVWDRTMSVNLRGTMLGCKFVVPYMRKRGGGSIVNTSSGSANSGALGYTAYAISKAAIESLTKHMATQHGKENIRCNAISPGFIQTDVAKVRYPEEVLNMMLSHHLSPRLGLPDDVAECVLYLASAVSAFITGQIISVDGGLLSHQPFYADEIRALSLSGDNDE